MTYEATTMEMCREIRSGSLQDFRCATMTITIRKSWRRPLLAIALLAIVACAVRSEAQEAKPAATPKPQSTQEPAAAKAPATPSWETIAATMQSAQTLLAAGDAGNTTQRRQRDAIDHLDALIAAVEANSAASEGQSNNSTSNDMNPGDANSAASTDGQNANPNALESVERHGASEAQAPEKGGPRRTSAEEFWGSLPKHVEERIRVLQSTDTRAVPKYRAAVESYFQRLLERETPDAPR